MSIGDTVTPKDKIELYKLEYEQCVMLYRNIYEEIWKIFSYLTAIGAGLLVLGHEYLSPGVTVSAASIPIIYWYLGIYIPMDRYGNMRLNRLADIEKILNEDYHVKMNHFTEMTHREKWKFKHEKYGFGWRVCTATRILAYIVIATFLLGFLHAVWTGQFMAKRRPKKIHAQVELKGPNRLAK